MSWRAPVVAHIDTLGYLYCVQCRPELADVPRDREGYPSAVPGDLHFGEGDDCDQCGKRLQKVKGEWT